MVNSEDLAHRNGKTGLTAGNFVATVNDYLAELHVSNSYRDFIIIILLLFQSRI